MLHFATDSAHTTRLTAMVPVAGLRLAAAACRANDATADKAVRSWPGAVKGSAPQFFGGFEMYLGTSCLELQASIRRSGQHGRSRALPE